MYGLRVIVLQPRDSALTAVRVPAILLQKEPNRWENLITREAVIMVVFEVAFLLIWRVYAGPDKKERYVAANAQRYTRRRRNDAAEWPNQRTLFKMSG